MSSAVAAVAEQESGDAVPVVNFVLNNGTQKAVAANFGDSIMQVATNNMIPGIEAVCGGFCNCATCHVFVGEAWLDMLPAPTMEEDEMLDGTAVDRRPASRLACQIKLSGALDGIEIIMPERQS